MPTGLHPLPASKSRSNSPSRTRKPKLGFPNIFRRHHAHPSEEYYHRPAEFPFNSHAHPHDEILDITFEAAEASHGEISHTPSNLAPYSPDEKPMLPRLSRLDIPHMHSNLNISFSATPSPQSPVQKISAQRVEVVARDHVNMMFPPTSAHAYSTGDALKALGVKHASSKRVEEHKEHDATSRPLADVHTRPLVKPLLIPFTSPSVQPNTSAPAPSGLPAPAKLRPLPPIPISNQFAPIPFSSNSAYQNHANVRRSTEISPSHTPKGTSTPPTNEVATVPVHALRKLPPVPRIPERGEIQLPSGPSSESGHGHESLSASFPKSLAKGALDRSLDDYEANQGELSEGSGSDGTGTPDLTSSSLPSSKSSSTSSLHDLVATPPPRPRRSSRRPQPPPEQTRRRGPRAQDKAAVSWLPSDCWSGPSSRAASPIREDAVKHETRALFSRVTGSQPRGDARQLFSQPNESNVSLRTDCSSSQYSVESMLQRPASP
ncbi:hypothetical protein FIBSPDRAFT_858430 [Athelia psychrophila]|uniref:Uncharacterized protein n=1 Tax=Athelia psychrophila TaxID=1759441 RepID=A0A166LZ21_9AGAM|nr:hypothetical protein FIBSPDRAFT_858430 [Fibularhizoctonia sp. CBS 109695]